MDTGTEATGFSDREPPDLGDDSVVVSMPDGSTVLLAAHVTQRIDAPNVGFREIDARATPLRHRFELSVGGSDMLAITEDRARLEGAPQEAARALARVAAAIELLRAEHAPPMPPAFSFDPSPQPEATDAEGGLLVGHIVVDEFRRRDVHPPRDGEEWFWYLDANEVPQYTCMEALVRDVVDLWELRGVTAMRGGSLWWIRSLHVHPRCRGHQIGGRLLGYALGELRKGPYDLAVLEGHPEPSIFVPAGAEAHPGSAEWRSYERPSRTGIEGLVRYFTRVGFMRADDPTAGLGRVQHIDDEDDDEMSRRMGVYEDGPDTPDSAVAMYAFLGDLRFRDGDRAAQKLGRRVRSPSVHGLGDD